MNEDQLRKKLQILSHLESSGGKNKVHKLQKTGLHKNTRAVSSYGLMPNTVIEFVKRNKDFQSTPTGQALLNIINNPEEINKITQQQKHDDAIMSALIQEQNKRLQPHLDETDDPELLNVYAHRRGVSGAINAAKDDSYKSDPYVKAYKEEKIKRFPNVEAFLRKK